MITPGTLVGLLNEVRLPFSLHFYPDLGVHSRFWMVQLGALIEVLGLSPISTEWTYVHQ